MDATHLTFLFFAIGVIAFLYSSVGHAGASGYIAIMTLWGIAPCGYQTNRARAQHSRRVHRRVSILARGPFHVETILAVCTAFNSSRLFWRLFATVRFRLENFDWAGASFLCRALDLSPR